MKMKIHSFLTILFIYFGALHSVFSQTKAPLGTQELRGVKQIQFQNRSNRRAAASVIQENTATGKELARKIQEDPTSPQSFRGIEIQRILPDPNGKEYGADLFRISPEVSFDHINSINRILASYIENSFQYSESNAETLATFVLYYNAAHRKDLKFFQSRYTSNVIKAVNPENVGIDISYKNWPGKTEIIIPISPNILKDSGQDVTTDELEQEVNKIVRTEKDPETRKKMEEESKKMDTLQNQKIQEEKRQVQERKQELEKKDSELAQRQQETERKIQETGKIIQELRKDPVKNQAAITQKQDELKQLEQEKAKIEEERRQVAETKEQLDKKEEELAKKEEQRQEAKKEEQSQGTAQAGSKEPEKKETIEDVKRELAQVREELRKKEEKSENVIDNKIFFMRFIKYDSDGHYSNELWAIDPIKDDALFKSPFTNICSKEFIEIPNQGILVLGYEGNKVSDRKHKLTILDTKTLRLKKQSDASDIFWRTPMVYTDDKIYVIEKYEKNYHLSRFNPDLSIDIRSNAPVEENSEITFFKDKIYITGKGKGEGATSIKVFQRKDLSLIKEIQP